MCDPHQIFEVFVRGLLVTQDLESIDLRLVRHCRTSERREEVTPPIVPASPFYRCHRLFLIIQTFFNHQTSSSLLS
jgi:hypothetical protein